MPRRPNEIIRPGARLTGRKLLEAIMAAGGSGYGGRDTLVMNRAGQQVVAARRPIVPRRARGVVQFPALLLGGTNELGPNRWEYGWFEARLAAGGDSFQFVVGGRSSNDPNRLMARNMAELGNSPTLIQRGSVLTTQNTGASIEIGPVTGTVVVTEYPTTIQDKVEGEIPVLGYWFDAPNPFTSDCSVDPPPPGGGPPNRRRFLEDTPGLEDFGEPPGEIL